MNRGANYGWTPDPDYAAESAARSPFKSVSQAASGLIGAEEREAFLWRPLWATLTELDPNYVWRPQYQKFGTCVGQGWKLAADTQMAISHQLGKREGGQRTKWLGRASVAAMYAGGRVEIAKQVGWWDGSNGYWMSDFVKKFGVGLLKDIGLPEDALDQDENLGRQWTASREGIPQPFEDLCRTRPIKSCVPARNFLEAATAIQNGVCVPNCSGLIPSGPLDKDGFYTRMSYGGHCQLFWGVRYDRRGLWLQNSWSAQGSGADHIGQCYPNDNPTGGGWVKQQWVDDILGEDDSFATSDVEGIPARDITDLGLNSWMN